MNEQLKLAWCAGYMEENGTWWVQDGGVLALSFRAEGNMSAFERFAEALDLTIEPIRKRKVCRIKLEGSGLKLMLQSVWPYLTPDKRSLIKFEFQKAKMSADLQAKREARASAEG